MSQPYRNRPLAQRLETARLSTQNAAKPALQAVLKDRGYPAKKITAGLALYRAASAAVSDQDTKLALQKIATLHVVDCHHTAIDHFQPFSKIARAIYAGDPGTLDLLGLTGPMPAGRAEFKQAATALFNTTKYTTEMHDTFEEHGWNSARLSEARGKISALDEAMDFQATSKTDAQRASRLAQKAITAMDQWMAKFIKIARVVFIDDLQALEQLGIVARSGPTPAQIAGRKKAAATRRKNKEEAARKDAAKDKAA